MDPRQLAMVPGRGFGQDSPNGEDRSTILKALKRVLQLSPVGYITDHMQEILGLPPEIARIDMVTFTCNTAIGAPAVITAQPATVRLNADYDAELFAMIGWVDNATTDAALGPQAHIEFNIREQGRNFDLFTTNVRMASLVGNVGSFGQVEFPRGAYVFRAHSDVQCRFQVSDALFTNTTVKLWGVTLLLNLARKK